MKLTPILLGCATIISAAPIHVVIVSTTESVPHVLPNVRVGHAAVHNVGTNFVHPSMMSKLAGPVATSSRAGKPPCSGSKALRLSNWFRQAIGLEPINPHRYHMPMVHPGIEVVRPTPMPDLSFGPPPSSPMFTYDQPMWPNHPKKAPGPPPAHRVPPPPPHLGSPHPLAHGGHRHFHGHHHHHFGHKSFTQRLQLALMSLGPWEGRFVAFVLGCGLGVLLRLFWVIGVLVARGFRRETEEREVLYVVEEEYLLAPPEYTDEKVLIAQAEAEAEAHA